MKTDIYITSGSNSTQVLVDVKRWVNGREIIHASTSVATCDNKPSLFIATVVVKDE